MTRLFFRAHSAFGLASRSPAGPLASAFLSAFLASAVAFAQPADPGCAIPIDDLGNFVGAINDITGGTGAEKYGSLGGCLDAAGASSRIRNLSETKRKELAGQLITAINDAELAGDRGRQSRANAIALLTELAAQGGEPLDALIEAANNEKDPWLKRQATLNLDRLTNEMNADQKKASAALYEEFFPSKPPYEAMFGANGEKTEVNYVIYGGDDTFAHGEWESVARQNGAEVKKVGPGRSLEITYKVTPDDPTGNLKPVTWKIQVRDEASYGYSDLRVFEHMNDPDYPILAYSYHSQYGRALRESMANAPKSAGLDKVFLLGSCKAKVFRSRTNRLYPEASLISTIDSEYFYDMSRSQFEMMNAYANRENWDQIRRRMSYGDAGLLNNDNYQFPNDRRALESLDADSDGIPDSRDTVFNTGLKGPEERSRDFSARDPGVEGPATCALDGDRLTYAVSAANGIIGYSSYAGTLEDKFSADGWGAYDKDGPVFTFAKQADGTWRVKQNPAYAHLDDTATVAALLHGMTITGLSNGSAPTLDQQIAATAMGAKVLDAWSGSGYWSEYQKKFGIPGKSLSMYDVTAKIDHDRGVTRETIDHIKKKLEENG